MTRWLLVCWLPLAACSLATARAGAEPHAERIGAAQAAYEGVSARHAAGMATLDEVCQWSVRWHRAQHEAGDLAAGPAHLARMEALSTQVAAGVAAGTAPAQDQLTMRYYVAEAKVWAAVR